MGTTSRSSIGQAALPNSANAKVTPDIADLSLDATLAALHANPDTGLTQAEIDTQREAHGYNEVAEKKRYPLRQFLGKFWGISAWMLELIMVLSAVLKHYSDLAVVAALLVINAVLSFMQEHCAASVVEALRKCLQVSARVLRDSKWQTVPARELVPGDIVRLRAGDFVPADVKLVSGEMAIDQSALTGDALPVAKEIGKGLGLPNIQRMADLKTASAQSGNSSADLFAGVDGFAEVFPEDKYVVVKQLQAA